MQLNGETTAATQTAEVCVIGTNQQRDGLRGLGHVISTAYAGSSSSFSLPLSLFFFFFARLNVEWAEVTGPVRFKPSKRNPGAALADTIRQHLLLYNQYNMYF